MSNRITFIVLAFMFAIILTVWLLGNLWTRLWAQIFGGGAAPQQASHQQQVVDRKQLREENLARAQARRERERYSPETLTAAARAGVPRPLATDEFDPTTGKVQWPVTLQGPDFDALRETLDLLLKERASAPDDPEHSQKALAAAEELLQLLIANIRALPTNDYIAARRFMDSLIFALRPNRTPG
jgi:hypothetical protein